MDPEEKKRLLEEARRRGLLSPDQEAAFAEAERRGLLGSASPQALNPPQPKKHIMETVDSNVPEWVFGNKLTYERPQIAPGQYGPMETRTDLPASIMGGAEEFEFPVDKRGQGQFILDNWDGTYNKDKGSDTYGQALYPFFHDYDYDFGTFEREGTNDQIPYFRQPKEGFWVDPEHGVHAQTIQKMYGLPETVKTKRTRPKVGRGESIMSNITSVATFGAGDAILDTVAKSENPDMEVGPAANYRMATEEQHPVSSTIGKVAGFVLPGTGAYMTGAKGGAAVAGMMPQGASMAARGGRYLPRLAGLAGGGLLDYGLYRGTVDAASLERRLNRPLTLMERATLFGDGATDPYAAIGGAAPSLAFRGANYAKTGRAAPSWIASEMANTAGVPVKMGQGGVATQQLSDEVTEGVTSPASIKSFRFIENALKDAGAPSERITSGYEKISQFLSRNPETRADLAQLLEGEFGKEFPKVGQSIRRFLAKVGMDSADGEAMIRQMVNQRREETADDLRDAASVAMGDQRRIDAAEVVEETLKGYGEAYDAVLRQAPRDGEAVDVARRLLESQPEARTFLLGRARAKGLSVDQYIDENPLLALHWLQSELSAVGDKALGKTALQMRHLIEEAVPSYSGLVDQFAAEKVAQRVLGQIDQNGKLKGGLGDRLLNSSRKEFTSDAIAAEYAALTPRQQKLADLSIRDALTDPLRGTRAKGKMTGANDKDGDVAGARMTRIQNEGVLDTLSSMLGERGDRLGEKIREFIYQRQYMADIDPRTGSNTANKLGSQADGAVPFSGPLSRQLTTTGGKHGESLMMDAALLASGHMPIVTALRGLPGGVGRMLQPRSGTQQDIAKTLMSRPVDRLADVPNPPPSALEPLPPVLDGGVAARGGGPGGHHALPDDPLRPPAGRIPDRYRERQYDGWADEAAETASQGGSTIYTRAQVEGAPDWPGAVPQRPLSLSDYVIAQGGIADAGGDVAAIIGGAQGRPGVLNSRGSQLDYMIERAAEGGYLPAHTDRLPTQREFLDLLDQDMRGDFVFPVGREADEYAQYVEWAARAGVETPRERTMRLRSERAERAKAGGLFSDEGGSVPLGVAADVGATSGGALIGGMTAGDELPEQILGGTMAGTLAGFTSRRLRRALGKGPAASQSVGDGPAAAGFFPVGRNQKSLIPESNSDEFASLTRKQQELVETIRSLPEGKRTVKDIAKARGTSWPNITQSINRIEERLGRRILASRVTRDNMPQVQAEKTSEKALRARQREEASSQLRAMYRQAYEKHKDTSASNTDLLDNIANEMGVTPVQARIMLKDQGISLPDQRGRKTVLPKNREEAFVKDVTDNGLSNEALREKYGLTPKQLTFAKRRMGLTRTTQPRAQGLGFENGSIYPDIAAMAAGAVSNQYINPQDPLAGPQGAIAGILLRRGGTELWKKMTGPKKSRKQMIQPRDLAESSPADDMFRVTPEGPASKWPQNETLMDRMRESYPEKIGSAQRGVASPKGEDFGLPDIPGAAYEAKGPVQFAAQANTYERLEAAVRANDAAAAKREIRDLMPQGTPDEKLDEIAADLMREGRRMIGEREARIAARSQPGETLPEVAGKWSRDPEISKLREMAEAQGGLWGNGAASLPGRFGLPDIPWRPAVIQGSKEFDRVANTLEGVQMAAINGDRKTAEMFLRELARSREVPPEVMGRTLDEILSRFGHGADALPIGTASSIMDEAGAVSRDTLMQKVDPPPRKRRARK